MRREHALAAAAAFFILIVIAYLLAAHAGPVIPTVVAQEAVPATMPVSNTVVVPYGDWISAASDYLVVLIMGLIAFAFRFIPGQLKAFLLTLRAEQLLQRAVTFGINAVAGATKDRAMNVPISNAVLREAVTYALHHGGPIVKKFMGSPTEVAEKVWSRLEIEADVARPNFEVIGTAAAADVAITAPARKAQEPSGQI